MSLNRRRWSNELLDSLIDFQNRTSSELDDPLNKSMEEVCRTDDRHTNLDTDNLENSSSRNAVGNYIEASMPRLIVSSSETSEVDSLSNNMLNFTMMKNSCDQDSEKANTFSHLNKVGENITLSSEGTANFFSCESSNNQNTMDTQSIRSQSTQYSCEIFHEAVTFHHENINKNKENSSSQSSENISKDEVTVEKNRFSINLMSFDNKQNEMTHRFFSSPVEFPNLDKEELIQIDHPDIWDALQELDQALSPIGEEETSTEEDQPTPNLLSRLSQKFKKTPSRFTEKLISILEDSVLSIESPTKHNAANNSGISLHRMTGEFRKLCKFIEDESMPEWAPSMVNITALCAEKTETPKNEKAQKNSTTATPKNMIRRIQETPTHKSSPLALRALLTPKNKIMSRNDTPIKQFTPSADKSFEYWEKICNMMCDPSSAEKMRRKTPLIQEGAKRSMDEMLTICERQMASLDDSTIDIRTSEPCKKTDSEIKLKVLQAPRSKSVSKLYESGKKVKSSTKKKQVHKIDDELEEKIVLQATDKEENPKDSAEKLINLDDTINDDEINDELEEKVFVQVTDKVENSKDSEEKLINFDDTINDDEVDDELDGKMAAKVSDKEENPKEEKLINLDNTINDTVIMTDSDNTSSDSSFLRRRLVNVSDHDSFKIDSNDTSIIEQNSFDGYEHLRKQNSTKQKSFENDFKLIDYTPQERRSKATSELSYDPDDPDCSLIAELALRRQRCLETAKLMMEIDQEDPMTSEQDKTCLETLYKLGIRDKTFVEVEEDTKFLNTLNECLEYRNYFSDKKKPIIKAFQKFDTTEQLKKKNTSIIRSQSQVSAKKPPVKSTLQRANSVKTLRDRKMTSRLPLNTELTPRVNRTSSNLKATPRISATTPRIPASTPRISSKIQRTTSMASPRSNTTTPRPMPRSTSRITPQVTKRTMYPQTEQSKPVHKLSTKTPQSLQKPLLRRPILRLSPKTTQKLTPPSELELCTPRVTRKLTSSSELKPCTPGITQKLTPPSELKPCTPRLNHKLTPPSARKAIASKPIPKRVADLTSPTEVAPSPTLTPRPRPRFFVSPGKSPSVATLGRQKPASYFSEKTIKTPLTPLTLRNFNHDVKSPIGLYINSVDNDLIKNIHAKTNDLLLTPVSYGENGKSPQLKIRLAAKENQSPTITCNENIVLPMVRYQSAKNVCLIDKKSNYSPSSIAPNSKTKKLLEPIENTVVIRHAGRMVDANDKQNYLDAEMSIRVQKTAEKTTPLRR